MKRFTHRALAVLTIGAVFFSNAIPVTASEVQELVVEEAPDIDLLEIEEDDLEDISDSDDSNLDIPDQAITEWDIESQDITDQEILEQDALKAETEETISSESEEITIEEESIEDLEETEAESSSTLIEEIRAEEIPDTALAVAETDITRLHIDDMQKSVTGSGVNVAVIDYYFPYDAFLDKKVKGVYDTKTESENIDDFWQENAESSHGNNCAKILLSVAPDVNLYLIRPATNEGHLSALQYAYSHNCRIISYSIWWMETDFSSSLMADIVSEMHDLYSRSSNSALIFSSGGNTGKNELHYPSCNDDVVGVSAAKYNATSKIYEPNAKNTYNSQIELCSPGSTTSAATPFAAGCAALLMEAKPGMTAAQCRKLLDDTALDVGNAGKDMYSGYGLIQPAAALKKINPSFQWTIGDLSKASLSVKTASYVYDGKAKKPVVTVKYGSDTLKEGTDYTLTYANNKTVGQATATVSGKGAYTGSKSTDFKILPAKSAVKSLAVESTGIRISWKKVAGAGEYRVYRDGKKIYTTSSASYLDKGARTNGKNYRYQVIAAKKINGQDYAGAISDSKSARFLSAPTIKTITNPKSRQMVVTWNKNASSGGYRLEYSLYSSFKNAKKVTVRGASTVSKRITGLQKNRTYYVRICAYRSLDESAWSKVKKLKVR